MALRTLASLIAPTRSATTITGPGPPCRLRCPQPLHRGAAWHAATTRPRKLLNRKVAANPPQLATPQEPTEAHIARRSSYPPDGEPSTREHCPEIYHDDAEAANTRGSSLPPPPPREGTALPPDLMSNPGRPRCRTGPVGHATTRGGPQPPSNPTNRSGQPPPSHTTPLRRELVTAPACATSACTTPALPLLLASPPAFLTRATRHPTRSHARNTEATVARPCPH